MLKKQFFINIYIYINLRVSVLLLLGAAVGAVGLSANVLAASVAACFAISVIFFVKRKEEGMCMLFTKEKRERKKKEKKKEREA